MQLELTSQAGHMFHRGDKALRRRRHVFSAPILTGSEREPNYRRAEQVFDDRRRKLAPLDTYALLKFPRYMRLDYRYARQWRG